MKPFFKILLVAMVALAGVTSAQAQIRIGLNGIELYSDPQDSLSVSKSKTKSTVSSYSSSYYNTKKNKCQYLFANFLKKFIFHFCCFDMATMI